MHLIIGLEREKDGRFIAEITSLPGVLAYGTTEEEARSKVETIALRVLAAQLDIELRSNAGVQFTVA